MTNSVVSTAAKPRRGAYRMDFTDLGLKRLTFAGACRDAGKPLTTRQVQVWDASRGDDGGPRGLSLLFSSRGTKTFLVTFYLHGAPVTAKIGRFGDLTVEAARARVRYGDRSGGRNTNPPPENSRTAPWRPRPTSTSSTSSSNCMRNRASDHGTTRGAFC